MAESEETLEGAELDEAPAGRTRVVALAGALVAILLVGAGAAYWWLGRAPEDADASAEAEAATAPEEAEEAIDYADELGIALPRVAAEGEPAPTADQLLSLEAFVVNISDRDRDRYLKVKADIELSNAEVRPELEQRMPQVRDLIISLLGSKTFEEVRSIEGKNFLREEILLRVNSLLTTGEARRVYFTEFVVQ